MKLVHCGVCGRVLDAGLSPYERFDRQLKRLFLGLCSLFCETKLKEAKS